MRRRRAMTLVEVLAATVLLALLVAAGVPLVRSASAVTRLPPGGTVAAELALLADSVLAHPARFGLSSGALEDARLDRELAWPRDSGRAPARVRQARPEAPADHAWLVFESEGVCVLRWIPLPPTAAGEVDP